MRAAVKNVLPAMAYAITLLVCYLVIRPYAEIGINDDWSYIKTAQVLAQTGRIVYNGWASPMLGWQLYFGALFIKLFGFSFTAVRFSTVIEAMATAFLLERIGERAGLNAWNATLATLTFVLSPLYFPFAFTFMTDISGVLCVAVCLYMCLRAVQAQSERSAMVWISLASLVNAVGGTARQNAWLGVLVMLPSTLWLLRHKRRVLIAGCISWVVGVGIVAAAMHWFSRQPYTIPESPFSEGIHAGTLRILAGFCLRTIGQLALLSLPVLLMFAAVLRSWNRRIAAVFAAGVLFFTIPGVALIRVGRLHDWLAPFFKDYITDSAFARLSALAAMGSSLDIARDSLSALLTVAIVLGILSFFGCLFAGARDRLAPKATTVACSWREIWIITGPFCAATFALLALIALERGIFDRYLLPLLMILLLFLVRYYQERVGAKLPWACVLLIALFGGFSAAATHDEFALYRGYVTAIDEIRSSGAPANTILGPSEFVGWTEIEEMGYIDQPPIGVPQGAYVPLPQRVFPASCDVNLVGFLDVIRGIKPVFAVSLNPRECDGEAAFPPVMYRTWIAPHTHWIYDVRLPTALAQ